VNTD